MTTEKPIQLPMHGDIQPEAIKGTPKSPDAKTVNQTYRHAEALSNWLDAGGRNTPSYVIAMRICPPKVKQGGKIKFKGWAWQGDNVPINFEDPAHLHALISWSCQQQWWREISRRFGVEWGQHYQNLTLEKAEKFVSDFDFMKLVSVMVFEAIKQYENPNDLSTEPRTQTPNHARSETPQGSDGVDGVDNGRRGPV